jgi:hypothetical protein
MEALRGLTGLWMAGGIVVLLLVWLARRRALLLRVLNVGLGGVVFAGSSFVAFALIADNVTMPRPWPWPGVAALCAFIGVALGAAMSLMIAFRRRAETKG